MPEPSTAVAPTVAGAQRNQRYAYLVARLRNRQMTMEEATELFTMMDGMLRTSEAARAAMMRAPPPGPAEALPARKPAVSAGAAAGGSDDFLLMGILALGAGAGLLAALSRRIETGAPAPPAAPPPAATPPPSRSSANSKSR
jgi:hypothetical protein